MVKVKRVCKDWQEIIDDNVELWKALILPAREDEWGIEPLKLFDEKSKSNLNQVSMPIGKEVDNEAFIDLLERSKGSLRLLEMGSEDRDQKARIGNQVWSFPNLVECKALPFSLIRSNCEMPSLKPDVGFNHQDHEEDSNSSPLKVLWVYDWRFPPDLELRIPENLVSLVIFGYAISSKWHKILSKSSRTLKQLSIGLTPSPEGEEEILPLDFPQLQFVWVLPFQSYREPFPTWIKPSWRATLRCSMPLLSSPSVSTIWIRFLGQLELLHTSFPYLIEFRFEPRLDQPADSQEQDDLLSTLRQRQSNAKAGMEVEGIKMLQLKTIVLPFKLIKPELLSEMRTLVDEVVDLAIVLKR